MNRADGAIANLIHLLRTVQPILDDPALTDFYVNGPGEACIERAGRKERVETLLTFRDLEDIAINAAVLNHGNDIGADVPFAGGVLPGGHRVQAVCPPATADGKIALAVRKPSARVLSMEEMERRGLFDRTVAGSLARGAGAHAALIPLYRERQWRPFLEGAAAAGLNIVFAGKQKTGKTSKLRSLLASMSPDLRTIPIQDLSELGCLAQWDVLDLYYAKGAQSSSSHTAGDCIEAAVRLGAELLPFQEVRDEAAHSLLYAYRSGIQVLTTIHANSADDVFPRMVGLVKQHPHGAHLDETRIGEELRAAIDVVVYCTRDYRVEQVLYDPGLQAEHAEANRNH